jgi:hypothetical protein
MVNTEKKVISGPIAGENLTSDTRNYPWHRPPDVQDYDEVVEALIKDSMKPKEMSRILSMLSNEMTLSSIVDFKVLALMSQGKFSLDMGILAAGPYARFLDILAKDAGISVEMGLEDENFSMTPDIVRTLSGGDVLGPLKEPLRPTGEQDELAAQSVSSDSELPAQTGFMMSPTGPASDQEQATMLGDASNENIEV